MKMHTMKNAHNENAHNKNNNKKIIIIIVIVSLFPLVTPAAEII